MEREDALHTDHSADPLAVRLEREIREERITLPVLPEIAVKVENLIEREAGIGAFVRTIEREPSIAAALLKYSNSAMYAGLRDVTDLPQAIMRLGLKAVHQTVLALSAKAAFSAADRQHEYLYHGIWTHSLTTAMAARRLAGMASVAPETAFLAGLLHDIGKVVVLRGISVLRRRDPNGFKIEEHTVLEFMEALHCQMGDVLCQAWNIPADLRDAIRRHHEADLSTTKDKMTAVVQIANLIAAKVGASLNPDANISLLDKPASVLLQLDDVKIATLLVDLEDDRQHLGAMF